MQVKFTNQPPDDSLLITPEDKFEAEALERWNNCVLSAKYDYNDGKHPSNASLLIVKEI